MKIYLLGAHGGYRSLQKPLGGGATIFESLFECWKNLHGLECIPLGLGPDYPILSIPELRGRHPAELNYGEYAQLCRKFESLCTHYLMNLPAKSGDWIISNDISEGPQMQRLREHGFRTMTIVHVDVAQFVNTLYLKNKIPTHFLTRGWRLFREFGITPLIPDIVHLIFEKQEQAYTHSDAILVPSPPMKSIILQCYPDLDPKKIHVIPWGDPSRLFCHDNPTADEIVAWRNHEGISENDYLILTLSRISPEKGIDRLLRGLLALEKRWGQKSKSIQVRIAGDAAYMDGPKTKKLLEQLIQRLQWIRVKFVGHLTGIQKRIAFQASDLYAFCSYHESYGLTLAEAKSEGCRCLISQEVAAIGGASEETITVDANNPESIADEITLSFDQFRFNQRNLKKEAFDRAFQDLLKIISP